MMRALANKMRMIAPECATRILNLTLNLMLLKHPPLALLGLTRRSQWAPWDIRKCASRAGSTGLASAIFFASLVTSTVLARTAGSGADTIILEFPGLHVTLASIDRGLGLVQIADEKSGKTFISPDAGRHPILWKLELTDDITREVRYFIIDNTAAGGNRRIKHLQDGGIRLEWMGVPLPEERGTASVTVHIQPSKIPGMTEWRINTEIDSESVMLWRIIFPVVELGTLSPDGKDDFLVVAASEGRSVRNPIGIEGGFLKRLEENLTSSPNGIEIDKADYGFGASRPNGLPYPGGRGQMQLTGYYEKTGNYYLPSKEKRTGLYLATHDPDFNPKVFFYTPDAARKVLLFETALYPAVPHRPNASFIMDYPMVIGCFQGDWYDCSRIYRNWALDQRWAHKGPLYGRTDVPDWIKHLNSVFRGDLRKTDNAQILNQIKPYREKLKGPMMVQWYNWSSKEKEPELPMYAFPPRPDAPPGFREIVQKLQDEEIYVFPYINTRIWYEMDPEFGKVEEFRYKTVLGENYNWEWKGHKAAHISLYSKFYNEYLAKTSAEIVRRYGVKGLYLDQSGEAHFGGSLLHSVDFNPKSGGPPGVSDALIRAERDRMVAISDAVHQVDPEVVLTGESVAEPFIDLFANKLTHFSIWPGYVPLFQAVYHDYITSYGRIASLYGKNPKDPIPRFEIGWQLIIGLQIGRLMPINPRTEAQREAAEQHLDYLQRAVDVRDRFQVYLAMGEMMRPPYVSPEPALLTTKEFSHLDKTSTMPAVLGSTWRAPDGSVLLLATNLDTESHTVTLAVDADELFQKPGEKVAWVQVYPQKSAPNPNASGLITIISKLDPLGIVAYRISSAGEDVAADSGGDSGATYRREIQK